MLSICCRKYEQLLRDFAEKLTQNQTNKLTLENVNARVAEHLVAELVLLLLERVEAALALALLGGQVSGELVVEGLLAEQRRMLAFDALVSQRRERRRLGQHLLFADAQADEQRLGAGLARIERLLDLVVQLDLAILDVLGQILNWVKRKTTV